MYQRMSKGYLQPLVTKGSGGNLIGGMRQNLLETFLCEFLHR